MGTIDITMLVGYFAIVGAIGWWASRRAGRSSEEYFLSGRDVGWFAIGASLFASNISTEHFIGLAGSGAKSGLAVGNFEWLACFILLILGWLFVPFYIRTGVFTMPEFLERRYNRGCRMYLSIISLVAYVLTKISVSLYAGALVIDLLFGFDQNSETAKGLLGVPYSVWVSAIVLLTATGAYTITGGLRAVIYTDLFQAFILIGGALLLTFIAVSKLGGLGEVFERAPAGFFNMWKDPSHKDFPWTGILFGAPILGVWYWCTDQMIVQRTLAAKNVENARRGTIFASYLKLLPVFILVLPGIAGTLLYPEIDTANHSDKIYPTMVEQLLPAGIKGLVVAALLAALMSSLSSVFNSSSTLVVIDYYRELINPQASEKELVRVGRIAVGVIVVFGLLWIPVVASAGGIFEYLQAVQAYIAPPIAVVFLFGVLWKGANGKGAMSALLVGFALGALRLICEIGSKGDDPWVTHPWLVQYATINFLHIAVFLFLIAMDVLIVVSLMTGVPPAKKLEIFARDDAADAIAKPRTADFVFTIAIVNIVLVLWFVFSDLVFSA
ncbi:MAG: sodium:solute symporter [Phycisphaerae bacterium]